MSNRKGLALLPVILCCLLLYGCGGDGGSDTPEQAAGKFIEALQDGDQEDIYAAVVRGEAESFQRVDERLDYNRWEDYDIEDFKINNVILDGNRAKVSVDLTREIDGKEETSEQLVVCVEEHKKWKVLMSASSPVFIPKAKARD